MQNGGIIGGGQGGIKSIQYGTVVINNGSLTGNVAIAAVDVANSILIFLGTNTASTVTVDDPYIELTSSILVTATTTQNVSANVNVPFVVVEFNIGLIKSIQRGTIALTAVATNTAALTAVVVAKTVLFWGGGAHSNQGVDRENVSLALTSTILITATRGSATANAVVSYQAVEFY